MTLTNKEALSRHRERSYSGDTYTSHSPTETTTETEISISSASPINPRRSERVTTKKHSNPRRYGNRWRSKSRDKQHRHSPTHAHRRRFPTKPHSPSHHHPHGHGRSIPKSSSSSCHQLCGHLWVRPVPVRRQTYPFRPVSASVAPHIDVRSNHYGIFPHIPPPTMNPPIRRVMDSPVYEEEMMWSTQLNSSIDSLKRQTSSKNARIIFGESGKPIQPRRKF